MTDSSSGFIKPAADYPCSTRNSTDDNMTGFLVQRTEPMQGSFGRQNTSTGNDSRFFTRVQSILGDINNRAATPMHHHSCLKKGHDNDKKKVQFADDDTVTDGDKPTATYESLRQRILNTTRVPTPSAKASLAYKNCRSGTPYPFEFDESLASFTDDVDDDDDDLSYRVISYGNNDDGDNSSCSSIECIVLNDDYDRSMQPQSGRTYGKMENDFFKSNDDDDDDDADGGGGGIERQIDVDVADKFYVDDLPRKSIKEAFSADETDKSDFNRDWLERCNTFLSQTKRDFKIDNISEDSLRLSPGEKEAMKPIEYESESEDELRFSKEKTSPHIDMTNASETTEDIRESAKAGDISPTVRYDRLDLSGLVSRADVRTEKRGKEKRSNNIRISPNRKKEKKKRREKKEEQDLDEVLTRRSFNTISVLPEIPRAGSTSSSPNFKEETEFLRPAVEVTNDTNDEKNEGEQKTDGKKRKKKKRKKELQTKADFNPKAKVLPQISGSESSNISADVNQKKENKLEENFECPKAEKDNILDQKITVPQTENSEPATTTDANTWYTSPRKNATTDIRFYEDVCAEPVVQKYKGDDHGNDRKHDGHHDTNTKNDDVTNSSEEKNDRKKKKTKRVMPGLTTSRTLNTESVLPRIVSASETDNDMAPGEHKETDSLRRNQAHQDVMRLEVGEKAAKSDVVVVGRPATKCAAKDAQILDKVIQKVNAMNDEKFEAMENDTDEPTAVKMMSKTRSLTVAKFRAQLNRQCTLLPKIGETAVREEVEKVQCIEEHDLSLDKSKKAKPSKSFLNKMEYLRQQNLIEYKQEVEKNMKKAEDMCKQREANVAIERCPGSHQLNVTHSVNPYGDIQPEYLKMFAPKPPTGAKPMHTRNGRKFKQATQADQEALRRKIAKEEYHVPHAPACKKDAAPKPCEKMNFIQRLFK
ncbi:hypothetical protein ACF0H5_020070 [Mactra antiquata]